MFKVRDATLDEAQRLLKIYDYYVKHTAITFEYVTPSLTEFKTRMAKTMERYPYLVVEQDGRVEGYAYAGVFKDRAAYDWACETTIYLDFRAQKSGMGRLLYETLENCLRDMEITNLYACISQETDQLSSNSADFHQHLGFEKVGEFHHCGYKFERWYDMIWMEKIIGSHELNPKPIKPHNKLTKE